MARYSLYAESCGDLVFQSRAFKSGIVIPFLLLMALSSCGGGGGGGGGGANPNPNPNPNPNTFSLTVSSTGTGTGTVTSVPAGINCGSDCSETYNSGTQVTLSAAAGTSSSFAGWSGSCSGTGSCVVTMDAAKSVTATFDLQKPPAPVLSLAPQSVKIFHFTWPDVAGETSYNLQEDPDGVSGFTTVATLAADATSHDLVVFLPQRVNARYLVQACNAAGCSDSATVSVSGTLTQAVGYFKASNTDSGDTFGDAVSLSGDGATLAIGASSEDSNGNEADNSVTNSGAVYIFVRSSGGWSQEAYIKASNPDASDGFGGAVALSADGNTLAVGATGEDSNATGINGNEADNSAASAGAVYVYSRSGTTWSQQAYVKASNTGANDQFGVSVTLSDDGNTLAVGAFNEDSNATGIDGNQADNSAAAAGAVYVFTRSGTAWTQQAYIKASNTEAQDLFGVRLSLSGDGNTLAVGATGEDSNATGIDGNQADNSASRAGAAYVFTRSGTTWS